MLDLDFCCERVKEVNCRGSISPQCLGNVLTRPLTTTSGWLVCSQINGPNVRTFNGEHVLLAQRSILKALKRLKFKQNQTSKTWNFIY